MTYAYIIILDLIALIIFGEVDTSSSYIILRSCPTFSWNTRHVTANLTCLSSMKQLQYAFRLTVIELLAPRGLWYTARLPAVGGRATEIKEDALRIFISGLLAWRRPLGRVSTKNYRKTNMGPARQHTAQ
jgi:hypothetical protein